MKQVEDTRLWTRAFILVIIMNLLLYLAHMLLMAIMTNRIKEMGGTSFQIGFVVTSMSITALVMRFGAGALLDRLGRKIVFCVGVFGLLCCYIAYFFSNVEATIGIRFVNGAIWGMAGTSMATICTDVVNPLRRGDGMGIFALSSIVAMALSPMLAILINNSFNFMTVLSISVAIQCGAVTLFFWLKIAPSDRKQQKKKFQIGDMFEKKTFLPAALGALMTMPMCGIMSFLILYGKERNMPEIWIYFLGHLIMLLMSRVIGGRLLRRIGRFRVSIWGGLLQMVGLLVLMISRNPAMVLLSSLFFGMGYGLLYPMLQSWAVNRSPENRKGVANGNYLASMDLGYMAASAMLAPFAERFSYSLMYGASAIYIMIYLLMVICARGILDTEGA